MRPVPYPAADDPLLVSTFGADVVGGMIVLCSADGKTADGQWNLAVVLSGEGMHALECVRRPDGRTVTNSTALVAQKDWSAVVERVATDAGFFSIAPWMNAQKAMADIDPAWDEDEALEAWNRAVANVQRAGAVSRARAQRRRDMTDEELIAEIHREGSDDPADVRVREIERAMDEFAATSAPGSRPN